MISILARKIPSERFGTENNTHTQKFDRYLGCVLLVGFSKSKGGNLCFLKHKKKKKKRDRSFLFLLLHTYLDDSLDFFYALAKLVQAVVTRTVRPAQHLALELLGQVRQEPRVPPDLLNRDPLIAEHEDPTEQVLAIL